MAEEGLSSNTQVNLSSSPIAQMSNPGLNNPTSTALRNNSGISAKSSIFVPQAGTSKLKLF
jgi:hypothetical protein